MKLNELNGYSVHFIHSFISFIHFISFQMFKEGDPSAMLVFKGPISYIIGQNPVIVTQCETPLTSKKASKGFTEIDILTKAVKK